MLRKLFRGGSDDDNQKTPKKADVTMDEVVETLNNNGLTRLTDFIKEKQLTIAHLLKQEVRSRVISTLRLSMKERFILMDSIKDAGPKTNSWGYPTNFAERHRIAEEYQVFHLLEERSPEEVRLFKEKHFYDNSCPIDSIAKWSEYDLPVPEYEDCIIYYDRWRDASRLPLSQEDLRIKAPYNKELNDKISIIKGNICELEVDAVVNAANTSLRGGGGIDGAIHSAAGLLLDEECAGLGGCETGFTKATLAYRMPCKYILHAVGPMREDPDALTNCYETVLENVKQLKLKSVALCCVSAGIFGFPLVHASQIAMRTVRRWMETDPYAKEIDRIVFCLFLNHELEVYERLMSVYFPRSNPENDSQQPIEAITEQQLPQQSQDSEQSSVPVVE